MQSFIFGGDTGTTYDDLKRRQALAQAMWAGGSRGTPKTAMEGLNSAAKSITGALLAKKLGGQIKDEQDEFGLMFKGALGGIGQPMGGGQPAGVPDGEMASFIKQGLVERGLPEHVADGFLMNFKDESGLDPGINERNPIVPGSRGGFGLAQWTGPRRVALEKFAQARGANISDPNLQMDFLVEELRGPESAAAQKILAAKDPGSAAAAIVNNFLRPAEEHRTRRAAAYTGGQGPNPMLMAMAADPRASDAQRSVLSMLMQQQVQASDPMRQLQMQNLQGQIDARNAPQAPQLDVRQLADGRNYYIDPTGQTPPRLVSPDLEMPEGPSSFIVSGAQAAEYGLPDDGKAYQVTVDGNNVQAKAVGGGGVTVNNDLGGAKFDEAFAKGDAATLATVAESGLAARRNIGRIDQLEGLLRKSDTGFSGAAKLAAGEWGINTDGLSELQAAQALINSLVPEQRQPGSGPMSDADLALFKQSLPRIINQPGGNTTIIQTMRAIAQYDAQGAAIVQDLRAGNISRAEAFEALQNRQNPLAGFTPPPAGDASDQPLTGDDYKNLSDEELLERLRAQ